MEYYHGDDSVSHKVKSLFFTVEQIGSQLMGVAECRVQGDLNDAELDRLKEYTSGQASDGFGEGFEQHPIKIGENELYVSLWSSNRSWNIMTQDKVNWLEEPREDALGHELEQGQQMGGMQLS